MDDDAPVIYGLEFQARALTAQTAETDAIKFLVGTQSLRFENQIHQIEFDDENNVITKNVFLHKEGEIWDISASPIDTNILATIYNKTTETKADLCAALWRMPAEVDALATEENVSNAPSVEKLTQLEHGEYGDIKRLLWHPSGEKTDMVTLADNHILKWDVEASGARAKMESSVSLEGKAQPRFTSGAWNPHHNCHQVVTANDTFIRGWDLRSMSQVFTIDNAHGQLVRDLDFNPNQQYYLASCGDDCKTKFWDIRNTDQPLKVMASHSHWVWRVRYNHFHDQLVLTSSSDSRVILSNLASISSEPFGLLVEEEENEDGENELIERTSEPLRDGVIATYEEHEDSVYAVAWSSAEPWLFASLSYDGRLVINRVPRATKYKILL